MPHQRFQRIDIYPHLKLAYGVSDIELVECFGLHTHKKIKEIYCTFTCADPVIFLRGGPTENALVLLYDTLISGFQWVYAVYKKNQRFKF